MRNDKKYLFLKPSGENYCGPHYTFYICSTIHSCTAWWEADMLINEALSTNKADYECDNQINMLDKHSNVPK